MPNSGTTTRAPEVLLVGDVSPRECQPILGCLRKHNCDVTQTTSVVAAVKASRSHDLLVVLQCWPDEFTRSDAMDLIVASPLARLAVCFGTWCESDGRTRDVWPTGCRVPMRQAIGRIDKELNVIRGLERALPLTAGRDETFEFDVVNSVSAFDSQVVYVSSNDRNIRSLVAEILRSVGHQVVTEPDGSVDAAVLDLDPFDAGETDRSADMRSQVEWFSQCGVRIVGLMTVPHPQNHEFLNGLGVDVVLPKLALATLNSELESRRHLNSR